MSSKTRLRDGGQLNCVEVDDRLSQEHGVWLEKIRYELVSKSKKIQPDTRIREESSSRPQPAADGVLDGYDTLSYHNDSLS